MTETFSEQFAGCARSAFALACGVLGNFDAAEEAVQEAAYRAWRAAPRFDASRPFRPWFLRIVRNTAVNELHRRARFVGLSAEPYDGEPSPADAVLVKERTQTVIRALNELPAKHRAAVVLRGVYDLDYRQISAVLEVPYATARIHVHRARNQLRGL
jgi:RNA polymerase sigma factor (sigma-70 family)